MFLALKAESVFAKIGCDNEGVDLVGGFECGVDVEVCAAGAGVMDVEVQFAGIGVIAGPPARGEEVGMAIERGARSRSMEVTEIMMFEVDFAIEKFEGGEYSVVF